LDNTRAPYCNLDCCSSNFNLWFFSHCSRPLGVRTFRLSCVRVLALSRAPLFPQGQQSQQQQRGLSGSTDGRKLSRPIRSLLRRNFCQWAFLFHGGYSFVAIINTWLKVNAHHMRHASTPINLAWVTALTTSPLSAIAKSRIQPEDAVGDGSPGGACEDCAASSLGNLAVEAGAPWE
jgi:hypothetical protein